MQTRCQESRAYGWPWASDVTQALVCVIVGLLLANHSRNDHEPNTTRSLVVMRVPQYLSRKGGRVV